MEKVCRTCAELKSVTEFYCRKTSRDGYYNICKVCAKGFNKGWKDTLTSKQKERYRRSEQAALYGLTLKEFEEMALRQNNRCYICRGTSQDGRRKDRYLSIDHDKRCCSGKKSCGKCVRKLLCTKCNSLLGMANDDINILMAAINYLQEH